MKLGDRVYFPAGPVLVGLGTVVVIDWRTRDTEGAETLIVESDNGGLIRVSAKKVSRTLITWIRSIFRGG
jgi:hypothetical protein